MKLSLYVCMRESFDKFRFKIFTHCDILTKKLRGSFFWNTLYVDNYLR